MFFRYKCQILDICVFRKNCKSIIAGDMDWQFYMRMGLSVQLYRLQKSPAGASL